MVSLQYFGVKNAEKHLVLIHAFPLSSVMYHNTVEALLSDLSDLQIILVDLPGFANAPYRAHWTLAEAMVDLNHQLNEQNIASAIIGGTSMGSYAAFAYYRQFPNEVNGLILSNTKAEADDEKAKVGREEFAQDVERRGHISVYERMLDKLISKNSPSALKDRLKTMIATQDIHAIASALRAMALRNDSTDLLATITCQTLVISGSNDELIAPSLTKTITERVSGSTYYEILNAGHLTPFETPKEWAAIVASIY
ncbi:MAG TPA: alpha/beta hydrolase [Candidatus Kapabacteria bacterium]|nr:alpha/beta hydrolase [Candidatus Kapabacteria bacterium]